MFRVGDIHLETFLLNKIKKDMAVFREYGEQFVMITLIKKKRMYFAGKQAFTYFYRYIDIYVF